MADAFCVALLCIAHFQCCVCFAVAADLCVGMCSRAIRLQVKCKLVVIRGLFCFPQLTDGPTKMAGKVIIKSGYAESGRFDRRLFRSKVVSIETKGQFDRRQESVRSKSK